MGKKGFFDIIEYCECGCGEIPKPGNRFIRGHSGNKGANSKRGRISIYLDHGLCQYGCKQRAYFQLRNGKLCCSHHVNQCPGRRIGGWNKGLTKETDSRVAKLSENLKLKYRLFPQSRKKKGRVGLVLDDRVCDYGCNRQAYFQFLNGKVCCCFNAMQCSAIRMKGKERKGHRKGRMGLVLDNRICDYGCGEKANYELNNGKACCSEHHHICLLRGVASWNKGLTKEDHSGLLSISEKLGGRTKETHPQLASKKKGKTKEDDASIAAGAAKMKGRTKETHPYLEEAGRKSKETKKGRTRETHSYIDTIVKKGSKTRTGRTKETYSYLAEAGRKISRTKRRLRIAQVKKGLAEGEHVFPSYNIRACKFFEQFDKDFNTQGQYGTNGKEYHIEELTYWLDYINFDLKLIIEWDEESHYDFNGDLKRKDILRQKEIQEYFPDFRFIRIREKFQEKELDCLYKEFRR